MGLLRKGQWQFPKVAGVITTPTLRPDGTILDQPGYDPSNTAMVCAGQLHGDAGSQDGTYTRRSLAGT